MLHYIKATTNFTSPTKF